jgi:hypothetical protein
MVIIRWMLLLTMNGRSNSNMASRSNGTVVCAQYAGRCSHWQLTCAEVASEAEVDYHMDAAAHAERPYQQQLLFDV